jgi:hypothetical protein
MHRYMLIAGLFVAGCSSQLAGEHQPDAGPGPADAARPADDANAPDSPDAAAEPGRIPIFLAARNYQEHRAALRGLGPFIVYAWATDPALSNPNQYDGELAVLADIDDPDVDEIIMFSSYRTLEQKLAQPGHLGYLQSLGVDGVGFNSEGFMTPSDEMDSLGDISAGSNAVARFSAIAEANGLSVLWGPIRVTADAVSDAAISTMFGAGLDGVGLQEQQFIESSCVAARTSAVRETAARYRTLAGGQGAHVNVQIMPSRCQNGDAFAAANCGGSGAVFGHCGAFAASIAGDVDSIGIWASSPDDRAQLVPLVQALRAAMP